MTNPLLNDRDISFLLYEVFDAASLLALPHFADHSRETFDCYSATSGLMVGSKSVQPTQMGQIPVSTTYSDYKKFGDFLMPTKTVNSMMGQEQVMTITAVQVGTGAGVTIVAPPEIKALVKPAGK